jgi:ATP-dependent helicase/nuclease subunit A
MNKLQIYSASAGSGKTHRLTGNVLLTLILNPEEYKYILAVTFTRKASEEMKTRILHELFLLSSNKQSDFTQEISSKASLSESEIRSRAQTVLSKILHHYSRFSYSTIDSFFQSIHRAFLREANIHSQFELQLDTAMVAEKSVNLMLNDIENDENLRKVLLQLIDSQLESNFNWQFKQKLTELFQEVFKERFGVFSSADNIKKITSEKIKQINEYCFKTLREIEKKKLDFQNNLDSILISINLKPDDFKGKGRSIPNQLLKRFIEFSEPTSSIVKACSEEAAWLASNDKNETQIRLVLNSLFNIANEYCTYYSNNIELYNTCFLVRSNLHYMELILDARQRIDNYLLTNNEYLLSDVTEFLAALTENNDSPFVYEKTGSFVNHYLIDEFQDTSNKQWLALKPLMVECLSHIYNQGMIVGDVKQSIYRWRNGNWRLLGKEVPESFQTDPIVMDDNWRSRENIVKFNNSVFESLVPLFEKFVETSLNENNHNELLQDYEGLFADNYKDVKQNIKKEQGGCVELKFYEGNQEDYRELSLKRCIEIIEELQSKGVAPGDIAILVRTNSDGQQVARYILDYGRSNLANPEISYRIVSNEALKLNSSYTIKIIIGLFNFFANSANKPALIEAVILYHKYYKQNAKILSELLPNPNTDYLLSLFDADIDYLNNNAKQYPLFELNERIVKALRLDEDADAIPFIEAFADKCSGFQSKSDSGLESFVEWWNANSEKQKLQLPDDKGAIRILTIHKSKGLGFGNVIIPFCDWSIMPNQKSMVWCNTDKEPFNSLNAYPLKVNKSLAKSYLYKDYFDEIFNSVFDNLNMLYVAFTRAKQGLFVGAPIKPNSESTNIAKFLNIALQQDIQQDDKVFNSFNEFEIDDTYWKIGEIDTQEQESDKKTTDISYPVFIPDKCVRIKKTFEKYDNNTPIKNGIIYHKVFENITDIQSVTLSVDMAYADGLINKNESEDILNNINNKLNSGLPHKWFSDYNKLYLERNLLMPNGDFVRPDRVMKFNDYWTVVDYKFGKNREAKHLTQVNRYAELIEQISGERVEAYVWYFFEDVIINAKKPEL